MTQPDDSEDTKNRIRSPAQCSNILLRALLVVDILPGRQTEERP
jgi:hypothetical protein